MPKLISSLLIILALLLVGCAGSQTFTFQNAPGTVQIPGNWKDASTVGKSKATTPDGKAWVGLSIVPRPGVQGDVVAQAEQAWKDLNRGPATFQSATINGRPGALVIQQAGAALTVVGVTESQKPGSLIMIVTSGEGVSESTFKSIVTSYKE